MEASDVCVPSHEKRKRSVAQVIEKALLKKLLDEGKINETEYNNAVSELHRMTVGEQNG